MCNVCTCTRPGCITCGYGLASHPHTRGIDHAGQEYPKGSAGYIDQVCMLCDSKLSRHTSIERTMVNWDGTPLPVERNDNLSDAQRLAMLSRAVGDALWDMRRLKVCGWSQTEDQYYVDRVVDKLERAYREYGKQD